MSELKLEIAPDVRSDLDCSAAAAGYSIRNVSGFTLLKPSNNDPLGLRGYFGFNGYALSESGETVEFGCLWRIEEEGDRYRIVLDDANKEGIDEKDPEAMKGWLPDPTRAVLEGSGFSWRLSYDVHVEQSPSVQLSSVA
jgi:hypothetical protein